MRAHILAARSTVVESTKAAATAEPAENTG
jgi:hypothetical protein